jgi:hypothetical protein
MKSYNEIEYTQKDVKEIMKTDNIYSFKDFYIQCELENSKNNQNFNYFIESSIINHAYSIFQFLLKVAMFDDIKIYPYILESAIESSNLEALSQLLFTNKFDINAKDSILLRKSIAFGQLKMVKLILSNRNTIVEEEKLEEAFYVAVKDDKFDVVKYLIDTNIIAPEMNDNYALRETIYNNCFNTTYTLLNNYYVTPDEEMFLCAVDNGCIENVTLLLEDCRIEPDFDNNASIKVAIKEGYMEIFHLLYADSRIDLSDDSSALSVALASENEIVIKILLRNDSININIDDNYALNYSVETANFEILELILNSKQTLDYSSGDSLWNSIEYGNSAIFDLLLQSNKIDNTYDNNKALTIACEKDNIYFFNKLYKCEDTEANIDCLLNACSNENIEIFDILINDENIDICDYDNELFIYACSGNNDYMIETLLAREEISISTQNNKALVFLAKNKNYKIIKKMLKDTRLENINIDEALYNSAKMADFDSLSLLIDDERTNPFNPNLKEDIINLVVQQNNIELTQKLLNYKTNDFVDNSNALMSALHKSNYDLFKILFDDNRFSQNVDKLNDFVKYTLIHFDKNESVKYMKLVFSNKKLSFTDYTREECYSRLAIQKSCLESFKIIYNSKTHNIENNSYLLEESISCDNNDIFDFLFNLVNKNKIRHISLMKAVNNNNVHAFKKLIEEKELKITENKNKAIISVIEKGSMELLLYCLNIEKDLDFTINNNEAIRKSYYNGHLKISRILFNKKNVKKLLIKNDKRIYDSLSKSFLHEAIGNF